MGSTKDVEAERTLLCGDLSRELPRQRSKVVRIFTSSTFTDTSTERNALMRDVYPRLKDYCKSRHGLEFQVIDMRWGVRDEATDDHMTSQLCMAEIEACQRLSVGPNFVTFLCQKYGYRPFPPRIDGAEFEALRGALADRGEPTDTLDAWFRRDDNCAPHVFVLQPISSRLPYFGRQDEPEKRREQQGQWWATFERLQAQLRAAAAETEASGLLTPDQAKKYRISVTHDEVEHGILNDRPDKQEHCLCFVRTFGDLEGKCAAKEASKFVDVSGGQVDRGAQDLLAELRDERVARALPAASIVRTDLGEWTDDGVNPEGNARHAEYVARFLELFFEKMVGMIDAGVAREKAAGLSDPLHQEIMQHLSFCVSKCVGFQGREEVIGRVKDYVVGRAGTGESGGSPLVLHGDSGSGKTSIAAKCFSLVRRDWLPSSAVVLRFLGTSPNTASIQRALATLCGQIAQIYGRPDFQIPSEYNQLVAAFPRTLRLATAETPLVVLLDSLDQLSGEHGAHRMAWLPTRLPPHAALVVSTLPRAHGILDKLRERLPSSAPYVQVAPFSRDESTAIIRSWLGTAGKAVTDSQLELIDKAAAECSLPLFLKLVFDQATRWRSYHPPEECVLKHDIPGMINLVLGRLEEYHGQILVSRALAYITLSPSGLTETELDDLLSLDDDVLNDVYQFWLPPVRRIPPSLWTRIRNDISSYLVERDSDGATVIYWYHRQFIETARQRYLSDAGLRRTLHDACAAYFAGTWAEGRRKPCRYSALQVERFGVPAEAEEDRKVAGQPLVFGQGAAGDGHGAAAYNLRKLTQLPFHLTEAGDWVGLKSLALCNFDFLLSKAKALSMQDVLGDFSRAEERVDDPELSLLMAALRLSSSVVDTDPDQLAPELIGRLSDASVGRPALSSLLETAAERGRRSQPLLPISTCQQPPGGILLTSLEGHTDAVVALAVAGDSRWAVTGSKDCTARVWLLESGTLVHTLTGHREAVYGVQINPDDQSCLTYSHTGEYMKSGKICVWNMETGDLTHRLRGHTGRDSANVALSPDGRYAVSGLQTIPSSERDDDENEDTDDEDEEVVAAAKRRHKEESMEAARSKEEEWNEEEYEGEERYAVIVWNLETGKVAHWLCAHTAEIKGVTTLERDDSQQAISYSQDYTLVVWDLQSGQPVHRLDDTNGFPVWKLALSADQRLMALHGCEVDLYTFPDCKFLGSSEDPVSSSTMEAMRFSRDKSRVVSADCSGVLKMFGTGEGAERELLKRQSYFERDGVITSMAISADERYIVATSGSSEAIVVDFDSFEVVAKLPHIRTPTTSAITPDCTKALTASEDKNIRVWDLGKAVRQAEGTSSREPALCKHEDYVYELTALHAGDRVITAGKDGTLRLWDVASGKMLACVENPGKKACHTVAVSSTDAFMVGASSFSWYVLSLPDFGLRSLFKAGHESPGLCVITPDDRRVVGALGQPKFQIRIYDLASGSTLLVVGLRSTSLRMLSSGVFVNQYENSMYDSSGKTRILQLISGQTGRVVAELCHETRAMAYDVSRDERTLASGRGDGAVDLWELAGGGERLASLEAHTTRVRSVTFSPDDALVASGADGGGLCIWDVRSRTQRHSIPGAHGSDVKQVLFSPDGSLLVSSAEEDNYLGVWDVQSGRHRMRFHTYARPGQMTVSARCNAVVVSLQDGRVMFLRFSPPSGASPPQQTGQALRTSPQQPTAVGAAAQPHAPAANARPSVTQNPRRAVKSSTCEVL